MAQFLRQEQPLVIGVGSGRSLKAAIDELPDVERPQHSCVSLIGPLPLTALAPVTTSRCGWLRKPKAAILSCQPLYLLTAPLIVTCGVTIAFIAPSPKSSAGRCHLYRYRFDWLPLPVTQRWFYFGARCGCLARIACGRGDAG